MMLVAGAMQYFSHNSHSMTWNLEDIAAMF